MVLLPELSSRLERILTEQRQQKHLQAHNLTPRKKILLVGPPGSGKTMTAAALAGELQLPLFTALYDTLIAKFMGETAIRLKLIFDSMVMTRGVYFFDEFDAIGSQRNSSNDVGEIRRVLNSFLLFLENDESESLIIASTNHPDLLDKALFRRFDDVLEYKLPDPEMIPQLIKFQLLTFDIKVKDWSNIISTAKGLSQAEIVRAAGEAAKSSILSNTKTISEDNLISSLVERKGTTFWLSKGV
jgi:SpoVK/Ycf46/Vps4 family AAA+-type ATPase